MTRVFLQPDDLRDLVVDQFGTDRRLAALDRLTGGSKKGASTGSDWTTRRQ